MTVHIKSHNERGELFQTSLLHFPCLGPLTHISAWWNAGQMVFIYSGSAKGNCQKDKKKDLAIDYAHFLLHSNYMQLSCWIQNDLGSVSLSTRAP